MSDVTEQYEDDLYDEASEEFPAKEDLKDRLVAVWVTGKQGQRKNADGKSYPWIETITLALDDGLEGDKAATRADGSPNLVGPAPAQLDGFQWSTQGMVSRLQPRLSLKAKDGVTPSYRPMIGRINSQKNKVKGRSDSWSIAAPTDEDKAVAEQHKALIRKVTAEVRALREQNAEDEAFD